jgi:hypothetical protein
MNNLNIGYHHRGLRVRGGVLGRKGHHWKQE